MRPNEKVKPRQGVVANTLNAFRGGASLLANAPCSRTISEFGVWLHRSVRRSNFALLTRCRSGSNSRRRFTSACTWSWRRRRSGSTCCSSSWSYGGSRCRRRARRTYWNQRPPASCRTTYAVAEVLAKTVVMFLRASGYANAAIVAIKHLAVDHIETSLSFIQSQLEIGARYVAGRVIVHCAPFDVEDSIGRTAAYRSVNATGSARVTGAARLRIGAQVAPVWEDCIVMATPRQTNVRCASGGRGKLRIAVGRQVNARESRAIQRVREWQRDGGYQIIRVISDVRRARHDTAFYLRYHVLADTRRRCCGSRRGWRGCWRRCRRRGKAD